MLCGLSSALLITQSGSIRTLSTRKRGALEFLEHSSLFFWEQRVHTSTYKSIGFNKRNDLRDIGQANFPDSKKSFMHNVSWYPLYPESNGDYGYWSFQSTRHITPGVQILNSDLDINPDSLIN